MICEIAERSISYIACCVSAMKHLMYVCETIISLSIFLTFSRKRKNTGHNKIAKYKKDYSLSADCLFHFFALFFFFFCCFVLAFDLIFLFL